MGVILKGHDIDLGRDVALKVLHRDLAKRPDILQRFVEEAQIGGQLQHPGIVPVYELGLMADRRPYFTMKLVRGRTLAKILGEQAGPASGTRSILDVFAAVCRTVAYAHARSVIHRDLKPANVMVGAFGEVQVVDWGLAKVLRRGGVADERRAREAHHASGDSSVVETVRSDGSDAGSDSLAGSVMGTAAYMSPEQARGDIDQLDERSDVFALGAILCELLTGAPPYAGKKNAALVQAAHAQLDDALERLNRSGAAPALVKLAKECMAPAREARPRSANDVTHRIEAHLSSLEERARVAEIEVAEARVRTQAERRSKRLVAALATSVVAIVLFVAGTWLRSERQRAQRVARTVTEVAEALSDADRAAREAAWAFGAERGRTRVRDRSRGRSRPGPLGAHRGDRAIGVRRDRRRRSCARRRRADRRAADRTRDDTSRRLRCRARER